MSNLEVHKQIYDTLAHTLAASCDGEYLLHQHELATGLLPILLGNGVTRCTPGDITTPWYRVTISTVSVNAHYICNLQ